MAFVVLAPGATALARSVVHSHQDSFGHELDLAPARGPQGRAVQGPAAGVALVCTCGWSGVLRADDVVLEHHPVAV